MNDEDEAVKRMEQTKEAMLAYLERMKQSGVELFMDGHAVLPAEAVARTVREDSPYMADYVLNEEGAVEQVRFDRVTRR
ncbi:MAG: hypothetical protein IJZ76_03475 [Lachnospiraceae bacterium]|nr:hypothetical protein [Lachnospiraceae bacterium]